MTDKDNKVPFYKIIFAVIYVLIYPALLLFISGDRFWIEGWIYGLWLFASTIATLVYLYFKDQDLLAERFKIQGSKNQKEWDKFFLPTMSILYIIWLVIMPLDAKRFEWTKNFPLWLESLGGIGLLLSSFFMFKSFADNTFTSPLVRIQKERNQYVVSTGVYGFIRHPMYLGAIFMFLGTPLLLSSVYGILVGVMLSFLFVGRIIGEEKMLENELEGYKEYEQKVKYRLIPFVW